LTIEAYVRELRIDASGEGRMDPHEMRAAANMLETLAKELTHLRALAAIVREWQDASWEFSRLDPERTPSEIWEPLAARTARAADAVREFNLKES
jgi:DNA/RNA-binding domain of Phe-tRNA-synthetase-like protein